MSKLDGVYTRLNLDGPVPERARPTAMFHRDRVWGPDRVPSTFKKKLMRVLVPIGFVAITAVVFFVGHLFFKALNGS